MLWKLMKTSATASALLLTTNLITYFFPLLPSYDIYTIKPKDGKGLYLNCNTVTKHKFFCVWLDIHSVTSLWYNRCLHSSVNFPTRLLKVIQGSDRFSRWTKGGMPQLDQETGSGGSSTIYLIPLFLDLHRSVLKYPLALSLVTYLQYF